jgi:hypothetical protein
MEYKLEANVVVCPHCDQQFIHNKVNGIALLQLSSDVEARKRMYLKLTLDAIERLSSNNQLTTQSVRKVIFDNVNDLVRDIHTLLGFGQEAE